MTNKTLQGFFKGDTQNNEVRIYAGPCSIESKEQFEQVAECIKSLKLSWIRGGAFKPRTNPHAFQGLGEPALEIMAATAQSYGLKSISEVLDASQIELVDSYVDAFQIGTRNMSNFSLLKALGRHTSSSLKPILFKRGMAATIAEWLAASEYISYEGNHNIVLCERGIRTFETSTRFTLDISAVPVVHRLSVYPICVDVSHPAGQADYVFALARAALASGADSLMIEVHPNPGEAKSDSLQQLSLEQFKHLIEELRIIAHAMGKQLV